MRKFTLFLTLMVAMVTTAMAQITSADQIASDKCYTIVSKDTGRGGMYAGEGAALVDMCGVTYNNAQACHSIALDATSPAQQFAFVSYNEKLYLYSVGEKKFVAKNGNVNKLTAESPFDYVIVALEADAGGNYFSLNLNGTNYITASPGWCTNASRNTCLQTTLTSKSQSDGWDDGAWFTITEAGDFDATEALAMLNPVVEPEVTELIDDTKEYYLQSKYINGTNYATGYLTIGNNSGSNYGTVKLGADKAQAFKFTLVEDGNNKYYTLSTEIAEGTGNVIKYIDCSHEYNVNGGNTGSNLILERKDATSNEYVIKTANGYIKGSSIMNGTYSGYHVFSDEADKANALAWTLVDATVQAVAPVITDKNPAEGATVTSIKEIVITLDKKVSVTGTRIKVKPAGTNNAISFCMGSDAVVSENGLTVTFPLSSEVTESGEYDIELDEGFFTSEDGGKSAAVKYSVTVEEPVIFPAEGGIVAGEAAFVAEGASYDGEEYATISGEIVGKEYSTANVKVAHTQKNTNKSKVQSGLVRWYKSDILTFTPMNNAKLTKIVFTGTTGDYQSELTASAGTVTLDATAKTITWTGEATEALTLAADNGQVRFASAIVTYEINTGSSSVAAPAANVKADTYYNAFDLELTAAEGAKIYYVTDDSELSSKANVYEGAIKVGYGETTIKAFAVADGVASPAVTLSYNVAVAAPKFSVEPGVYESIEGFEMTTESEGATIIYLQNNTTGKDVKNSNFVFIKPVNIMATREYEAIAYVVVNENDTIWSDITKAKYYISWKNPYKAVKEITTGAKYVIEYNNAVIAPIAEKSNSGYPVTAEAAIANGYAEALAHYAYTITAVENEDETAPVVYTIQDTFGRYLYGNDNSSIYVAAEKPETGADWEITIDAETGKATVKNVLLGKYLSYYENKNNFNLYSSAAEVTLYEETEYPNFTTTPSGGYGEEIESIKVVTISCESGLALVEEDAPAVVMTVTDSDYNKTEYTAVVAMTEDGNITLTFEQEFTENGDYYINIPAGMFRMDPNGLNSLNEERNINISIFKAEPIEILGVTPTVGNVEQIEIIKIKFNQLVQPFIMGSLTLACADGDDVELQLVYELYDEETQEWIYPAETEVWVAQIDENGQIAPITAKGTYTLDLEDITFYVNNAPALVEGTYTWTIAVTTGIEGVDAENGEQVIYDLTGRRIKEINNAGIYVVNGKKVIVK